MISHLLDAIFKLQYSDSFETLTGAPRVTPWTWFITRHGNNFVRYISSVRLVRAPISVTPWGAPNPFVLMSAKTTPKCHRPVGHPSHEPKRAPHGVLEAGEEVGAHSC